MPPLRAPLCALSLVATSLAAQQSPAPQPPPQPPYSADSGAVMQVVTRLFDGMRSRDTTAMRAQFHDSAAMRSAANTRAGMVITTDAVSDWLRGVQGAPDTLLLDERIHAPMVRVDGNLATVWTPYEFYLGPAFSHCGADLFTLGRFDTGWRIVFVADSRHRAGCPSSPSNLPVPFVQPPLATDSAFAAAAVRRLLEAMRVRDTIGMRHELHGAVSMSAMLPPVPGRRMGSPVAFGHSDGWIREVGAWADQHPDERIASAAVEVDGNLAQVTAYYEFRMDTTFSHCGVDQFVLGRTAPGWKVIGVAYSVRRTECAQSTTLTPRQLALRDLVSAERAFARYADTANARDAFLWALRDDAITFDQTGLVRMRPKWQARAPGHALLSWAPSWADVSEDGTLGVTTGPWTWRPARDSAVQERGQFLTIWRKGPDRWQVALDLGIAGDSTADLTEPVHEMPAGVTGRARLSDLTDLDKDRLRGANWVEALRAMSTPDIRVLREQTARGDAVMAISGASSVRFAVLGGTVANSGDLGATWGTWKDGDKKGSFVRIWKRTAEGWRVVVDRMGD